MTAIELRNSIIHKVEAIDDASVLRAINDVIDAKSRFVYKTSLQQRQNIEEGRNQIADGNYISNEQVELEIDQWLSEK